MAASADIKFKESLLTALRCLNLGTLTLRKEQENAVKNVVVRKKDVLVVLPTGFGKSLIFWLHVRQMLSKLTVGFCGESSLKTSIAKIILFALV